MLAKDIMTQDVITASPDMPSREIAQLLLRHRISAVPVVEPDGTLAGMVSEGDLTGHKIAQQQEKREWWLTLLAEGEAVAPEFLSDIQTHSHRARDLMSAPVISVSAETDVTDIAKLLMEYHIKRVPVLENGRIVGIVSRADLLRAMVPNHTAPVTPPAPAPGIEHLLETLDRRLHTHLAHNHARKPAPDKDKPATPLSVMDFQKLVTDFHHTRAVREQEDRLRLAEQHKRQVAELINHHVDEGSWQSILHNAREAAERGEKEYMLLRFPNELCTDGGRAINVLEENWRNTLQGEAAEIYTRWETSLRPQGFHIAARVLEYPGGFPGDIGLFLLW